MDIKDCIKFANENPTCFLATVEGDQPRVRALLFWKADETGFYLQTGAKKEMCNQLGKNPKAEICFYKPDQKAGMMLRVAGKTELVEDVKIKAIALEQRPFLKGLGIKSPEDPNLIIYRIKSGTAYFWTMENNLKPKEYIRFGK